AAAAAPRATRGRSPGGASAEPPGARGPSPGAGPALGPGARPGPSLVAGGDGGLGSGLGTDWPAARAAPGELAQDRGRVADIAAPGQRLELAPLPRAEVARVLVCGGPCAHARRRPLRQ